MDAKSSSSTATRNDIADSKYDRGGAYHSPMGGFRNLENRWATGERIAETSRIILDSRIEILEQQYMALFDRAGGAKYDTSEWRGTRWGNGRDAW